LDLIVGYVHKPCLFGRKKTYSEIRYYLALNEIKDVKVKFIILWVRNEFGKLHNNAMIEIDLDEIKKCKR
jgi:hypothetical protein